MGFLQCFWNDCNSGQHLVQITAGYFDFLTCPPPLSAISGSDKVIWCIFGVSTYPLGCGFQFQVVWGCFGDFSRMCHTTSDSSIVQQDALDTREP